MNEDLRARFVALVEQVDPVRLNILVKMAEALTAEVRSTVNPTSDFLTPDLAAALGSQLLMHHATHEEKLNKKTFEYIIKYACEAAGQRVILNTNPTLPAEDLRINGTKFSLKTQADKGIKAGAVYVQKLMEARWIRDCTTPDELTNAARQKVGAHLAHYERMLVLRAFDVSGDGYRYELVEVPLQVLRLVSSLPDRAFSAKNKAGSSGADVCDERGIAFRVLLDGSVEKVRVFNLRIDRCVVHASWHIPRMVAPGVDED